MRTRIILCSTCETLLDETNNVCPCYVHGNLIHLNVKQSIHMRSTYHNANVSHEPKMLLVVILDRLCYVLSLSFKKNTR